jgi:Fic family protein
MNTDLNNTLKQADILKARLQAIRPLNVEALQKIRAAFEIEYTYESNKIEGNTLILQETALVVSEGVTIGGKSIRKHLEAINHALNISKKLQTAILRLPDGQYW